MATRDDEQMWELRISDGDGRGFTFPLMTRCDAAVVRDIIMLKCGGMVNTMLSYGPPENLSYGPPKKQLEKTWDGMI